MGNNFSTGTIAQLAGMLLATRPINIGEWQSTDVSKSPAHATYELMDITFIYDTPETPELLAESLGEDLNHAWAEEHFQERVGGLPLNPPPSHERWPWSRHNGNHQTGENKAFSHSYPERMWPKHANPEERMVFASGRPAEVNVGIRYALGDLADVLDLLVRSPLTRQAYLPIWFPEDTGNVWRHRVPCTLGYHFMVRDGEMTVRYYMRSCDLIRHFTDDIYLTSRLLQWMIDSYETETGTRLKTGRVLMHISSLHAFKGDEDKLRRMVARAGVHEHSHPHEHEAGV